MSAVSFLGKRLGHVEKTIHALDGVSFEIAKDETSTQYLKVDAASPHSSELWFCLRLQLSGRGGFEGKELTPVLSKQELRRLRSKIQIVFQDPISSLDSRMRVSNKLSPNQ